MGLLRRALRSYRCPTYFKVLVAAFFVVASAAGGAFLGSRGVMTDSHPGVRDAGEIVSPFEADVDADDTEKAALRREEDTSTADRPLKPDQHERSGRLGESTEHSDPGKREQPEKPEPDSEPLQLPDSDPPLSEPSEPLEPSQPPEAPVSPDEESTRQRSFVETLEVRAATWPRGKSGAASLTFDDGTKDHYRIAAPVLEEMGVRGTFYVITDKVGGGFWNDSGTTRAVMSWDQLAALASAGHEIGSHSATHSNLTDESVDLVHELVGSRLDLERNLPGVHVDTISWPSWQSNPRVQAKADGVYLAARGGTPLLAPGQTNPIAAASLADRYNMGSIGLLSRHFDGSWDNGAWLEAVDSALEITGWAVLTLHGVRGEDVPAEGVGWAAVEEEDLVTVVEELQRRDLWIAPFREVAAYKLHREQGELSVREFGPDRAVLRFSGAPAASHLDVRLTLQLQAEEPFSALLSEDGGSIGVSASGSVGAMFSAEVSEAGGSVQVELYPGQEVVLERRRP